MDKDIILTIWFDNTFGCSSRCKFCYVYDPIVDAIYNDYVSLENFLSRYSDEILLVKILGQEPYDTVRVLNSIGLLKKYNISEDIISFTTVGIRVYNEIIENSGSLTLSFSGFDNSYYGFKSEGYPYKKNITEIFTKYGHKIEKINWIIGTFNLAFLERDIQLFFDFLDSINFQETFSLGFLLQKGTIYTKEDVKQMKQCFVSLNKILQSNSMNTYCKYMKGLSEYKDDIFSRELTYCYDRKDKDSWFRCTYEITDVSLSLKDPITYLKKEDGIDSSFCTKKCTHEKSSIKKGQVHFSINSKDIFYYKLMLHYLSKLGY